MKTYSTRQAASKLGLSGVGLANYIKTKKVPAPQIMSVGGRNIHAWTEDEIENVRKLLPKIANGRKTRYQKKHSAVSTHGKPGLAQHSAKAEERRRGRLRSKNQKKK